jgi:hypothetical protein
MSFVGPRPLLPIDHASDGRYRLCVRPGLTGWAQVNGGRELSAEDKAALDIWYIQHMSLALDLTIAVRTWSVLTNGERVEWQSVMAARRALLRLKTGQPGEGVSEPPLIMEDGRSVAAAVELAT